MLYTFTGLHLKDIWGFSLISSPCIQQPESTLLWTYFTYICVWTPPPYVISKPLSVRSWIGTKERPPSMINCSKSPGFCIPMVPRLSSQHVTCSQHFFFFSEQIGGKLVSKHRCFGAALPTLSGTTTNKSSYAWLNESPPHPAPSTITSTTPSPRRWLTFFCWPPLRRVTLPPCNRHKSNVRSTTCDTLQRNKQIKVRTADHFFEVMAFAVVTTSGRANKWTVSQFSLSKPN